MTSVEGQPCADIECEFCDGTLAELPLYMCKYKACRDYYVIYCEKCGKRRHKKSKSHKFNIDKDHIYAIVADTFFTPDKNGEKKGIKNAKEYALTIALMKKYKFSDAVMDIVLKSPGVAYGTLRVLNVVVQRTANLSVAAIAGKSFARGLGVCGIAAGVIWAVESSFSIYHWYKGDITGKECGRLIAKSFCRDAASTAGFAVGAAAGGALGSLACPVLGTIIGIALGALIGCAAGYFTDKAFESKWKKITTEEEEMKEVQLILALKAFGYDSNDLVDKTVFNLDEINRRFRSRALEAHPDRGGSTEKFQELSMYWASLKAFEEETNKSVIQSLQQAYLNFDPIKFGRRMQRRYRQWRYKDTGYQLQRIE